MKVKRGDVVLAYYPLAAGTGSSRRPVLIVQSDVENQPEKYHRRPDHKQP